MDLKEKAKIMDKKAVEKALTRIAHEILERNKDGAKVAVIGIKNRGAYIGKRIADKMEKISGEKPPVGALDITLYRDDLTQIAEQPVVHATEIDFNIDGKKVILADDVLYTGRTVRCALDAVIDFGRPSEIQLAVLVDRGHRELPIKADYIGKNIPTSSEEVIEVKLSEADGRDEVILCEKVESR